MSHHDTCPDRWEARREGERAHDDGYGSFRNPYDRYDERRCPDAADAWRSGWYDAERRQEEREAEAAHERAMRRRIEEDAAYQQALEDEAQAQQYYAMQDERSEEARAADAVDPQVDSTGTPTTRARGSSSVSSNCVPQGGDTPPKGE